MRLLSAQTLAKLIDGHAAALELYAAQWTDTPADVVQESFIALVDQQPPPQRLVPWLYRVVRRRAVNSARACGRRRRHESLAAAMAAQWSEPSPGAMLDAQAAAEFLATIDAEQREVIVARIWGDLTFEQIAEIIGISASTAYRRYQSGLTSLRERLNTPWPT